MDTTDNCKYFEDFIPLLTKLQKEDKFLESIQLVEDLGNKIFLFLYIF